MNDFAQALTTWRVPSMVAPMRKQSVSKLDLVDAAYRVDLAEVAWLEGLAAACGAMDQGLGVLVTLQSFDARAVHGGSLAVLGNPALATFSAEVMASVSPAMLQLFDRPFVCGSVRRLLGAGSQRDPYLVTARRHGIHDVWGIAVREPSPDVPSRSGVLSLVWPTARDDRPSHFQQWVKVAFHLSAALRLRHALASGVTADVVLSPRGKVLHAEGSARSIGVRRVLSDAVRRVERAHTRGDDEGLSLWQGLVDGRWSIVERREPDGARSYYAFPNAPRLGFASELSLQEQAVVHHAARGVGNKAIAYALGLGMGSVSTYLARALRKLRISDRAALSLLAASLEGIAESQALAAVGERGFARLNPPVPPTTEALAGLSPALIEVARMLAEGLSNVDIAARRGTSVNTARNQIARLMSELGATSRSELAAWLRDLA